jgi:hypothetical protein
MIWSVVTTCGLKNDEIHYQNIQVASGRAPIGADFFK